jgi:hypothetical protein
MVVRPVDKVLCSATFAVDKRVVISNCILIQYSVQEERVHVRARRAVALLYIYDAMMKTTSRSNFSTLKCFSYSCRSRCKGVSNLVVEKSEYQTGQASCQ